MLLSNTLGLINILCEILEAICTNSSGKRGFVPRIMAGAKEHIFITPHLL